MSIQDREWYQEELRKKQNIRKAAPLPAAHHTNRPAERPSAHWVVKLLLWATVFTVVLVIARKIL
ncbi:hypothetical protein [Ralstonia pseudosolanacearum]|uniref:hypothetical protein n=1 Tax=Ralstonia pseudosolanacearum TaxID=1310165 RepID=UPI003C2D1E44